MKDEAWIRLYANGNGDAATITHLVYKARRRETLLRDEDDPPILQHLTLHQVFEQYSDRMFNELRNQVDPRALHRLLTDPEYRREQIRWYMDEIRPRLDEIRRSDAQPLRVDAAIHHTFRGLDELVEEPQEREFDRAASNV